MIEAHGRSVVKVADAMTMPRVAVGAIPGAADGAAIKTARCTRPTLQCRLHRKLTVIALMAANVLALLKISTTTLVTAYQVMALLTRGWVATSNRAMAVATVVVGAAGVVDVVRQRRPQAKPGRRLAQITLMTWKTRLPRTLSQVIARRVYVFRMTFQTTSVTVPLMSRNRKLMTTSVIGSGMCPKM